VARTCQTAMLRHSRGLWPFVVRRIPAAYAARYWLSALRAYRTKLPQSRKVILGVERSQVLAVGFDVRPHGGGGGIGVGRADGGQDVGVVPVGQFGAVLS
jgi:hypothetical protein